MNHKSSGGHGLPFEILKWALLIYTGYRSLDILMSTMPSDNMIMAVPGLLGLDVGVLVWSYLYEKKAEGNQATLAALLTVADLVGVFLCLIADSIMHSNQAADYADFIGVVAIWLVSIVIFLNVVGGILYPMLSPSAERIRKEKEMNAAYELKRKEAEHELALAQIELANARTRSDARSLVMQATDTLYVQHPGANRRHEEQRQPAVMAMAKDAPGRGGVLDDAPTDDEIERVRDWLTRTGKKVDDPK